MADFAHEDIIEHSLAIMKLEPTKSNPEGLHAASNAICAYIADLALKDGVEVTFEHFESNGIPSFIAYTTPERPENAIIYTGHGDVVDDKPEQLKPGVVGDKLYGRGANDMIPNVLVGGKLLVKKGPKMPKDRGFILQVGFDEEVGGANGVGHQVAKQGVRGSFAIAAECGRATDAHEIANAAKGAALPTISLPSDPMPGGAIREGSAVITSISTDNNAHNKVPNASEISVLLSNEPGQATARFGNFLVTLDPNTTITYTEDERGVLATVVFTGASAHGSRPWLGDNAAERAHAFAEQLATQYTLVPGPATRTVEYIRTLREQYPAATVETPDTTVVVTSVNVDEKTAEIKLDTRSAPGDANLASSACFTDFLQTIDPTVSVSYLHFVRPVYTDPGHPLLELLQKAAEKVEKVPSKLVQRFGTSDAPYFAEEGIAVCEYGIPGEGAHGDNEHTPLEKLAQYYDVMSKFLDYIIEFDGKVPRR